VSIEEEITLLEKKCDEEFRRLAERHKSKLETIEELYNIYSSIGLMPYHYFPYPYLYHSYLFGVKSKQNLRSIITYFPMLARVCKACPWKSKLAT
jgi:hypothetical protein